MLFSRECHGSFSIEEYKSHEIDSLLKFIFSNPNGLFTCYSMYPQR